ncbi:MAG: type II and III secretion system protein family protein [Bdellovibrionales bacterium]
MSRRILFSFWLLILLTAGPVAHAAEKGAPLLNISVDHGQPITLSGPAASVFIANPEIADVQVMSPTSIMVFGKKTGETTLMATDGNGRTLLHRTVIVTQDLTNLRRELAAAIPDNKIQVATLPDAIVLTGETRDPIAVEDARKIASRYVSKDGTIINRIQVVGSNQIMLRVRFAEVSRTVDKQFGINWSSLTTVGGFVFGLASGSPVSALSSIASTSTLNGETTANTNQTNGFAFSRQGGRWNVNGLIDALAEDGLISILAEPNLTAMSGETANFLAGGQVPVPIPQANGTISIQYMPYGIQLQFTPTLVGGSRINLHVKPEVSQLSSVGQITVSNLTAPAFTTRKAETTVELASGQSFAIAGLLDNNQDQTIQKFPFLGDVPILGPLFRSTQFQNDQTELVIVVTPYLVKPGMSEQAMALPMDGYSPPSDAERILKMRNSSSDPNARPVSGAAKAVPVPLPPPPPIAAPAPLSGTPAPLPPVASNNLVVGRPVPDKNQTESAGLPQEDDAPIPAAAPVVPVSPDVKVMPVAASRSMPSSDGFILE